MTIACWIRALPSRSLAVRVTLLSGMMVLLFAGMATLGFLGHGAVGVAAVAVAGGICWVSAVGAMCASRFLRSLGASVADILVPMIIRTGIPLVAVLAMRLHGHGLMEAGAIGYLLAFYFVALAVEVPLSFPLFDCGRRLLTPIGAQSATGVASCNEVRRDERRPHG